jgi:hypothetical protein
MYRTLVQGDEEPRWHKPVTDLEGVPPADVFVLTLPSGAPTSLLQPERLEGAAASTGIGAWSQWLAVLQSHSNATLHAVILIGDTCTNGLPSP